MEGGCLGIEILAVGWLENTTKGLGCCCPGAGRIERGRRERWSLDFFFHLV